MFTLTDGRYYYYDNATSGVNPLRYISGKVDPGRPIITTKNVILQAYANFIVVAHVVHLRG